MKLQHKNVKRQRQKQINKNNYSSQKIKKIKKSNQIRK